MSKPRSFFEVNLLFISQKALNTTQFQAKKKQRPSEKNTSDPSGKLDFSKLPYGFSSFECFSITQWFSFLIRSSIPLLEMGGFSFSFGLDTQQWLN